ncbi:MAG: IS110 family transposase [Acetobacteraceae bacterium]|nr:IS110 family transposase [Acetobacteraceae bacterium]
MMKHKRIAIDTSKHAFTLHGVDEQDSAVLRRNLKRSEMEAFFRKLAPTEVVMEACGGAHHWGRLLSRLGHRVRLIPAQYVKPFVKRAKNDRADAAAINDAASRPDMPVVAVKSAEQQASTMILKHREMLVGQRTAAINALRGHAAEFGVIAAKGTAQIQALLERLAADEAIPAAAKTMFAQMGAHIAALDQQAATLDEELLTLHKANPVSQSLAAVPGIGPISAITLALSVEPTHFASGRHFAAWLGLTPKEHSTGGRPRLGRISKAGNERLRQLLVVGATAVIRHAKPGKSSVSDWLLQLLARKPRKLAAVALANKTARIVWAMMARGEAYRRSPIIA